MVTLKEYEIYLKVKKFIEASNFDESDISKMGLELFLLTFH